MTLGVGDQGVALMRPQVGQTRLRDHQALIEIAGRRRRRPRARRQRQSHALTVAEHGRASGRADVALSACELSSNGRQALLWSKPDPLSTVKDSERVAGRCRVG